MKKQYIRKFAGLIAATAIGIGASVNAQAALFSVTSGSRSASVEFLQVGTQLQVTLINTSGGDVLVPVDVLTAVFFNLPGVTLSSYSAVLGAGSPVLFDSAPAGGVVGGEWGYGAGLVGAPLGAGQGISSSGFGLFGSATFPGLDLEPPAALDGLQYGITSAGDNAATGNAAVTGGNALIKNSVVFLFDYTGTLNFDNITDVSFQYGTSLSEPNIAVPEPATIVAGALLLLPLGASTIRILRKNRAA